MSTLKLFEISPIVPVVVLEDAENALALADALLEGGIAIMEITLRSDAALKSIAQIARKLPQMSVGAGTVITPEQMHRVQESGGNFCFSPGISHSLLQVAQEIKMPFIPGVATASDVMMAVNAGIAGCKLFPASAIGGIELLKGFSGPFPSMRFCPTGGINLENMNDYLKLGNVDCVGGSWIVPKELIASKAFDEITRLCKEALLHAAVS